MPQVSVQTTDTGSHTLIDDGNAATFAEITDLIITNESATAAVVSLSDGTVTYKFAIGANGGMVANFKSNLRPTSPSAPWTVQASAAATLDFVACYQPRS